MQGASEQCMQATEIERSPGTPSLSVTTRRRFTPQGTSCSALQAVVQPLHSMQRSLSQMNFMRAMAIVSYFSCRFASNRVRDLRREDAQVGSRSAAVHAYGEHRTPEIGSR